MHPQAEMFRNRLLKNLRRLKPWVKERGVVAYRLFDRDIPEIGLAVDRYDGRLHVSEYHKLDREARSAAVIDEPSQHRNHEAFLDDVLAALAAACDVAPRDIYLKRRQRQRGAAQYERLAQTGNEVVVAEGGHRFRVNLQDYLDTGLFLDHRDTRRLVQRLSAGRRVLNLFCYTGSFTVYAARGGASATTSVDLSKTYLEWAARNLAENGEHGDQHVLCQGDARLYLKEGGVGDYDLIILDPPTFSNSKRMDGVLDLQRDHPELLRDGLRRLSADGVLIFSSNYHRLDFLPELVPGARFTEVSELTVPFDFHDRRTHRCWLVQHEDAATTPGDLVKLLRSRA